MDITRILSASNKSGQSLVNLCNKNNDKKEFNKIVRFVNDFCVAFKQLHQYNVDTYFDRYYYDLIYNDYKNQISQKINPLYQSYVATILHTKYNNKMHYDNICNKNNGNNKKNEKNEKKNRNPFNKTMYWLLILVLYVFKVFKVFKVFNLYNVYNLNDMNDRNNMSLFDCVFIGYFCGVLMTVLLQSLFVLNDFHKHSLILFCIFCAYSILSF